MNLPNKLTVARLVCTPFFMVFTYVDNVFTRLLALLIFIAAGITDLIDGYLARKYNLITPLGVFLDPLADKFIITAALISFVELTEIHIPAWMVVLIVGREFIITGLRALAASQGKIVAADKDGKFKTSIQTTAILTVLTILIINSTIHRLYGISLNDLLQQGGWRAESALILEWAPYWAIFITTFVSIVTGIGYLRKHKNLFLSD